MGVFELLIICALIGLGAWALTTYIPMSVGVARVIQIVAIVIIVAFVLSAFGLIPRDVPVPRLSR
jgi:hypothetical protein